MSEYVLPEEFCRLFEQEMNSLFRLALLTTGKEQKAEEVFAAGLELCLNGGRVFREWAHRWARRAVIKSAVQILHPATGQRKAGTSGHSVRSDVALDQSVVRVMELDPFERMVWIMSVLEQYADGECAALLGCTREQVSLARGLAFQQIAGLPEMRTGVAVLPPPPAKVTTVEIAS
ncbi:MAG: hypothetical protein AB7O65_12295 [Candidatus Korobacteraceae bacterium]